MHHSLKQKLALLFFLCTTLLGGQIATLTHAADHPFHQHQELCDAFLAFQHNAPAIAFALQVLVLAVITVLGIATYQSLSRQIPATCAIRAPPVFVTPR